jgi:hypothetical protein
MRRRAVSPDVLNRLKKKTSLTTHAGGVRDSEKPDEKSQVDV